MVVGGEVLEGKIQEVGSCEVGRHGIKDLLMGMVRHDAGGPLLVDPFVTRGSTGMISFPGNVNNDESVNNYGNNKGGGDGC